MQVALISGMQPATTQQSQNDLSECTMQNTHHQRVLPGSQMTPAS